MADKQSPPPPYSAQPETAQSYEPPQQYGFQPNMPPPYPQQTPVQSAYPQQPGQYPQPPIQKLAYPPAGSYPNADTRTSTATIVTVTTPTAVFGAGFGENAISMKCPYCEERIVSRIQHVSGALAWILCATFLFAGFLIPVIPWFFCCVPFCLPACQDVEHHCPKCHRLLGTFRRVR